MAPVTARSMAWRCARRHTRAWYLPLGCAWCHPGAATEALEAVQPLGIAAPTPKRSTTQPIPASRAPPESPMGTRCPPPPPRLQASRSTSASARGAAYRMGPVVALLPVALPVVALLRPAHGRASPRRRPPPGATRKPKEISVILKLLMGQPTRSESQQEHQC